MIPGDSHSKPAAIAIFGASGDLARRKLIPAIYNNHRKGRLPTLPGAHFCSLEALHPQLAVEGSSFLSAIVCRPTCFWPSVTILGPTPTKERTGRGANSFTSTGRVGVEELPHGLMSHNEIQECSHDCA